MGSFIEINDTLQLTREQGFPEMLVLEDHIKENFRAENFKEKVFEFKSKPNVRLYKMPPVRNFLVEKTENGKWIYWGLCHVLETICDYENKMTSGKFKIIYINTPEEMKKAHELIDRNPDTSYFI